MMTKKKNIHRKLIMSILSWMVMLSVHAEEVKQVRGVFTNPFTDNWEVSFGVEGLSFYSSKEEGLGLSKSPFKSFRANFGAAATVGKWFTPEIGLRTKASGYWGKAFIGETPEENAIRFYALQASCLSVN